MPSCNRPALLEETLRCLLPHALRHEMRVLIGENCAFTEGVRTCIGKIAAQHPAASIELIDLTLEPNPRSPQVRMLRSVDRLYALVDTRLIFHCEDDWWLSDEDFITPSRVILERFPDIKIVRLTGSSMQPLPQESRRETLRYGEDSTAAFYYSRYGGPGGVYGAFTFHPGLRRKSDYIECFGSYERFGDEAEISKYAQSLGHREAILDGVFVRHIGAGASMMQRLHSLTPRSSERSLAHGARRRCDRC